MILNDLESFSYHTICFLGGRYWFYFHYNFDFIFYSFTYLSKTATCSFFNMSRHASSSPASSKLVFSNLASTFFWLCLHREWQSRCLKCHENNIKPWRHSFIRSWFMGLETKVLSFSRNKRKQNEQKCQKINSSIFLVLNQVTNQENKTFNTNL